MSFGPTTENEIIVRKWYSHKQKNLMTIGNENKKVWIKNKSTIITALYKKLCDCCDRLMCHQDIFWNWGLHRVYFITTPGHTANTQLFIYFIFSHPTAAVQVFEKWETNTFNIHQSICACFNEVYICIILYWVGMAIDLCGWQLYPE